MSQPVDPGLLIPGYSGRFYKADGSRWATCTSWELQLSITSTDENPLGTFWLMAVAQSGSASLTVSELVIDDDIMVQMLSGIQDPTNPNIPKFRFIGERIRPDGLTSTLVMDGCTLDGTNRIASATPGETMTRDLTFRVSVIPDPGRAVPSGRMMVGTNGEVNETGTGPHHVQVEVLPPGGAESPRQPPKPPKAMSAAELRAEEPDIVSYLFQAEEARKQEVATLQINWRQVPQRDDDGKVLRDAEGKIILGPFTIHFRRLSHEEINIARRKAKKVWQVGEEGRREFVPDDIEVGNWLIYLATVVEERTRPGGWDDPRLVQHYQVGGGPEVPSKFLSPGEWAQALMLVNEMAGLPKDERFLPLPASASDEPEAR